MRGFLFYSSIIGSLVALVGCTTIPSFTLSNNSSPAPSGPKVAALMANLKCELWDAVHDTSPLPVYKDLPNLDPKSFDASPDRVFNLKNIFEEIAYVASAQFTLDVTATSAFNPSLNFVNPYTATTNLTLSVGGQLSDVPHRNLNLYTSVDSERLIASPVSPLYASLPDPIVKTMAAQTPVADADPTSEMANCNSGSELGGRLGLKEVLATSLIAERMNDIAVLQAGSSGNLVNQGTAPDKFNLYSFGQIATQIDFTITEAINGGPNWTLTHFKGPGGSTAGPFLNLNRQVKDTLVITFLPVCIRQKYVPLRWITGTDVEKKPNTPWKYPIEYRSSIPGPDRPEAAGHMDVGTPLWANYLPPCNSPSGKQNKEEGTAKATVNTLILQAQTLTIPGNASVGPTLLR